MARAAASKNSTATIHCQVLPSQSLTMALPPSVKAVANLRSTAAITRNTSRGPAPTHSGGCFSQ